MGKASTTTVRDNSFFGVYETEKNTTDLRECLRVKSFSSYASRRKRRKTNIMTSIDHVRE
jgi:hypothetical protein